MKEILMTMQKKERQKRKEEGHKHKKWDLKSAQQWKRKQRRKSCFFVQNNREEENKGHGTEQKVCLGEQQKTWTRKRWKRGEPF